MVATGLLLWAVKERQKHAKALAQGGSVSFGLRLVEGLNLAAVAGLPLTMAGFLWGNRLLPMSLAARADAEIQLFFGLWALCAVLAVAWPSRRMWRVQLGLGAMLWLLVPVLNALTGGLGLLPAIALGQWQIAGFDLTSMALGGLLLSIAWMLARRKPALARASAAKVRARAPGMPVQEAS